MRVFSCVPLALQLPLLQPRHTGPASAGVSRLHCYSMYWAPVSQLLLRSWGHCLLFGNSSQVMQHLMEAAPRLQRHPQSTGASGHQSSNGSNKASNRGMRLCSWGSLVPSVQPWGWLHPRCFQHGILIMYLTAAPSSSKDSPFPQAPAISKIHREQSLSAPLQGYTHQPWSLWQSWKEHLLNPQSQEEKIPLSRVF